MASGLGEMFIILSLCCALGVGPLFGVAFVFMVVQTLSRKGRMGINVQRVSCPRCQEKMPAARAPRNARQMLWGGWTCPRCGCEMDKWGKEIGGGDQG